MDKTSYRTFDWHKEKQRPLNWKRRVGAAGMILGATLFLNGQLPGTVVSAEQQEAVATAKQSPHFGRVMGVGGLAEDKLPVAFGGNNHLLNETENQSDAQQSPERAGTSEGEVEPKSESGLMSREYKELIMDREMGTNKVNIRGWDPDVSPNGHQNGKEGQTKGASLGLGSLPTLHPDPGYFWRMYENGGRNEWQAKEEFEKEKHTVADIMEPWGVVARISDSERFANEDVYVEVRNFSIWFLKKGSNTWERQYIDTHPVNWSNAFLSTDMATPGQNLHDHENAQFTRVPWENNRVAHFGADRHYPDWSNKDIEGVMYVMEARIRPDTKPGVRLALQMGADLKISDYQADPPPGWFPNSALSSMTELSREWKRYAVGNLNHMIDNNDMRSISRERFLNSDFPLPDDEMSFPDGQLPNQPQKPANQAPTGIELSGTKIANDSAGATVGTLTTKDPDKGNTFSYSVNDERFEIVDGNLKLKIDQTLSHSETPKVDLKVTSTDQGGLSVTQDFTIEVEAPPTPPAKPEAMSKEYKELILEREMGKNKHAVRGWEADIALDENGQKRGFLNFTTGQTLGATVGLGGKPTLNPDPGYWWMMYERALVDGSVRTVRNEEEARREVQREGDTVADILEPWGVVAKLSDSEDFGPGEVNVDVRNYSVYFLRRGSDTWEKVTEDTHPVNWSAAFSSKDMATASYNLVDSNDPGWQRTPIPHENDQVAHFGADRYHPDWTDVEGVMYVLEARIDPSVKPGVKLGLQMGSDFKISNYQADPAPLWFPHSVGSAITPLSREWKRYAITNIEGMIDDNPERTITKERFLNSVVPIPDDELSFPDKSKVE